MIRLTGFHFPSCYFLVLVGIYPRRKRRRKGKTTVVGEIMLICWLEARVSHLESEEDVSFLLFHHPVLLLPTRCCITHRARERVCRAGGPQLVCEEAETAKKRWTVASHLLLRLLSSFSCSET